LFASLEAENRVLQDTVNARIAAGRALPVEATLARQEAVQLADRRDELTRKRAQAQAALSRWVGELADAPLAGDPPPLVADPTRLRENLEHHAELAAFQPMARIAAAEAREAQAGKKGDWGWEVSYAKRGPAYSDMMSFQVSFELLLFASTRIDPRSPATQGGGAHRGGTPGDAAQARREIEWSLPSEEQLARQLARLRDTALPWPRNGCDCRWPATALGGGSRGRAGRAAGTC
jgi:hypothetical protein